MLSALYTGVLRMKKALLIIEDEEDLRAVIVDVLQEFADSIVEAVNGEDAIHILENQRFSAILSDINMPKKNGFDVLQYVREQGLNTPFIFLSGYGDAGNLRKALRYQATDIIEKPFEELDLIEKVKNVLAIGALLIEKENELLQMIESLSSDEILKKKMIDSVKAINVIKFSNKKG